MGVRVSDTNSETSTPKVTTTANDLKNKPIMPSIKITGAKIQISVRDDANTANTTSLLPLMVAWVLNLATFCGSLRSVSLKSLLLESSPTSLDMCRMMLSRTTIASSTTTPMSSNKANKVMELKVKPAKYITAIAPINETGISRQTIKVERNERMKMSTISAANSVPSTRCSFNEATI